MEQVHEAHYLGADSRKRRYCKAVVILFFVVACGIALTEASFGKVTDRYRNNLLPSTDVQILDPLCRAIVLELPEPVHVQPAEPAVPVEEHVQPEPVQPLQPLPQPCGAPASMEEALALIEQLRAENATLKQDLATTTSSRDAYKQKLAVREHLEEKLYVDVSVACRYVSSNRRRNAKSWNQISRGYR